MKYPYQAQVTFTLLEIKSHSRSSSTQTSHIIKLKSSIIIVIVIVNHIIINSPRRPVNPSLLHRLEQ